jgi:hypothetical protein
MVHLGIMIACRIQATGHLAGLIRVHEVKEHTLLMVESIILSMIIMIEVETSVSLEVENCPSVNAPKRQ